MEKIDLKRKRGRQRKRGCKRNSRSNLKGRGTSKIKVLGFVRSEETIKEGTFACLYLGIYGYLTYE